MSAGAVSFHFFRLYENVARSGLLLAVAILPWALPPYVNGILWKFVFSSGYGFMNKASFSKIQEGKCSQIAFHQQILSQITVSRQRDNLIKHVNRRDVYSGSSGGIDYSTRIFGFNFP